MKNVMTRAWEIYRTLTGDKLAKLSQALKMAWAEVKSAAKDIFNGFAKVAKAENADSEHKFLYFKGWEKYGKKRIYINDYKNRTLGFIENDEVIIKDNQGNYKNEIDYAISSFKAQYAF